METRGRKPKVQNIKLFFEKDEYQRIQQNINIKCESVQDFMTIKAIEALNVIVSKPKKESKECIQFMLDSTIHKLLKERAKELNVDMSDLLKEVLK